MIGVAGLAKALATNEILYVGSGSIVRTRSVAPSTYAVRQKRTPSADTYFPELQKQAPN